MELTIKRRYEEEKLQTLVNIPLTPEMIAERQQSAARMKPSTPKQKRSRKASKAAKQARKINRK